MTLRSPGAVNRAGSAWAGDRRTSVYVLHERVESSDERNALVLELVLKARVAIAHGQMPEAGSRR